MLLLYKQCKVCLALFIELKKKNQFVKKKVNNSYKEYCVIPI